MKDIFVWYMIASLIGAWALLAYAFYKISQMSRDIYELSLSKANVRSIVDNHAEILSEHSKRILLLQNGAPNGDE